MYKFIQSLLILIIICVIFPNFAEETQDSQQAILILDASGSMWGKIDDKGKTKIEIARDVINDTLTNWNSDVELGLMAYGHNRKGDCEDIELLVKPGPLDVDSFQKKARNLSPKGKTPLTAAVQQAAETLKYSEEKATVILISDGKETCNLDPCAVGQKLEQTGVDFTAHIISFDVPKEQTQGMRCLAETTGGAYLEASNAEELKKAMQDAREVITESDKPVLDKATLKIPESIPAGAKFDVEWTGPKNRGDYLIVRTPDRKKHFNLSYIGNEKTKSPTEINAPEKTGKYKVFYEVDKNTPLGEASFEVTPVKATVNAPDSVVAGAKFEVEWTGPRNELDRIRIFTPDGKKKFSTAYVYREKQTSPSELKAPEQAGEYLVRYITNKGNILGEDAFLVSEASATVNAPESVVAGSVFEVEWTGPRNKLDSVQIFSLNGKKKFSYAYVYREKQTSPSELTAPETAGEYLVRYKTSGDNTLAEDNFRVTKAVAMVDAPDSAIAGNTFEVAWLGPKNKLDSIKIFSPDGKKEFAYAYVYTEKQTSPSEISAPETPGDYLVRYTTREDNTLAEDQIKVIAATASVEAPESVIAGAEFAVAWTGPSNKFDMVQIFSIDGKKEFDYQYTHREEDLSPATITAPESSGTYLVRYKTRGDKALAEDEFKVVAAEASVAAPDSVTAGAEFDVEWTGPRNKYDLVQIFSNDGKKEFDYQYTYREEDLSPARISAPEKPGNYLVRYRTRGGKTLAEDQFTVK